MLHRLTRAVILLALSGLAACTEPVVQIPSLRPEARIVPPVQDVPTPSLESENLAIHYKSLQEKLLAQDLLRTDGGGVDTPFTDTILARNFVRIALFDEYVTDGDLLRPQATLSNLRRWDQPVRFGLEFGASVPPDQREKDKLAVSDYAARLARVTGHPMRMSAFNPNFYVLMLSEDDRPDFADRIREIVPGIGTSTLNAMINLPRDQLCIVVAFSRDEGSSYSEAIAIIRAEHPPLLRLSCIHEELAQGLGLANDSPKARPSIFNDDEEFGLLTTHDELLLKMLYDPRFTAGMMPAEAAPIARTIARELLTPTPS